jgi:hypothetical protein
MLITITEFQSHENIVLILCEEAIMKNIILFSNRKPHIIRILFFLILVSCIQVKANNYIVGVPVSDTVCVSSYSAFCSNDFLAMALDSTLIPYVTGLDFQVEITAVNGTISSNVSDTVRAGDLFTLPTPSELGSLVINLPEQDNSFGFIINILGTPSVAGEDYYCNPTWVVTLKACFNLLTVLAFPLQDSICTVQTQSSLSNDLGKLPAKYELKQNYPNPFNSLTNISYSTPVNGFVTLKIYDLLGNEIQTMVHEFQQAGNYSFNFNANTLTSGIYFYELRVGKHLAETKKMLLLK